MLAYPNQLPALQKAYKYSYGLTVTAAQLHAANRLKICEIRPGVYAVGKSIVDIWRNACTCATMRQRKKKGIAPAARPCVHFLALQIDCKWSCNDHDPTLYLRALGYTQPKILAAYARLKGFSGIYRISESQYGSDRRATQAVTRNADQYLLDVPLSSIRKIYPFYE
jgi:hypothetical protein